jgi:AcrR family transcriptional regulator
MNETIETIDAGRRERSKAANRQAILEAARIVFAQLGYESTTVRDIIRRTELASGTFYNYFKSKEEVFEALADDSAFRFRPRLASVRSRVTSVESYIHGAFLAYFEYLKEEQCEMESSGGTNALMVGVRFDTPEMKAVFDEVRADVERVMAQDGVSELDAEYLTAAAVGMAREIGDRMLLRRPIDPVSAAEFAASIFLKGVADARTKG